MQCLKFQSTHIHKNGKKKGKQNHMCVDCSHQFIDQYDEVSYSDEFKRECWMLYLNGMGFQAIERVKKVHHTTVITWVKQVGELLSYVCDPEKIPEVGELDELQTFVGAKKQNLGLDGCTPLQARYFSVGCG